MNHSESGIFQGHDTDRQLENFPCPLVGYGYLKILKFQLQYLILAFFNILWVLWERNYLNETVLIRTGEHAIKHKFDHSLTIVSIYKPRKKTKKGILPWRAEIFPTITWWVKKNKPFSWPLMSCPRVDDLLIDNLLQYNNQWGACKLSYSKDQFTLLVSILRFFVRNLS